MEAISLKLDGRVLREIDRKLKEFRYGTRTEFIREAIRQKLSELEKEEMLRVIAKMRGISKKKTTDEDLHKAREKAFEKIDKKFNLK